MPFRLQPVLPKRGTPGPGRSGRRDPGALQNRPRPKRRPRSPFLRGVGPGCIGKGPVGASASPRPGPASSPPFPGRRRSSYPQDVVAFRAPAWNVDALRRAHGGGRSVLPGRAPRCSPPPANRPLRSAPPLSTWDVALAAAGEPGRSDRREIVSAAARAPATPQTAPPAASHLNVSERARVGWAGRRGEAGRGLLTLAREQMHGSSCRHLATGPWVGQDSSAERLSPERTVVRL